MAKSRQQGHQSNGRDQLTSMNCLQQLMLVFFLLLGNIIFGQVANVSKAWVSDNGNGTYKNPVLHADYSDPDAIRVGDDYYLTASSFNCIPGLPILHSKDLVNWTIIGYALQRLPPYDHFAKPQHGNGVWAPAIRFHNGEFYIYYPDPDFGIYLTKAKNITGAWSDPILVEGGKGLIDPCPLWDDNGKAYLVHAFAGSRAGIKSILVVQPMNAEGTKIVGDGVLVYDGHDSDPTIEGPKFYIRNGYYYIFAPAGGVSTGWQLALRSKNIYGPYERKVVMDQGYSPINGPHQGAWVQASNGEDWFLHFQDKGAYGRILHLQPMKWVGDWPVIGEDKDGDGKGEPVLQFKKPATAKSYSIATPQDSDEFNSDRLGLQWQWHANPQVGWAFPSGSKGSLRLFSYKLPDSMVNYWNVPNLLLQKLPAEEFTATTKFNFKPLWKGEKFGFIMMGASYAYLCLTKQSDSSVYLSYVTCNNADKSGKESEKQPVSVPAGACYFRITVTKGAVCSFSYSTDGKNYIEVGNGFIAQPGRWIGAKIGYFCTRPNTTNDAGWADIDWFRITK
jgi:beta-xylosidase